MKNFTSRNNNILEGITFEELITTIQSNEKEVSSAVVLRVYGEILSKQKRDAITTIVENMDFILDSCKIQ